MNKFKVCSIFCVLCLVFNVIFLTLTGVVYAENSEECNITLDFGDEAILENGAVHYGTASIKLCYIDGNNAPEYVEITNKKNTPINVCEHSYFLEIDGDNVELRVKGMLESIPGDKLYGLHSNCFEGNGEVVTVYLQQNNQHGQPGDPGQSANEGRVILGNTEIIDITDENKVEYSETGVKFIYNEEERMVIATLEDNKTLDNIEVIGDIDLKIIFKGQNSTILSDNNISIKVPRRVMLETAQYNSNDINAISPKLTLNGGIVGYTIIENQTKPGDVLILTGGIDGGLLLNESNLTIGTEDNYSSSGIVNVPKNDGDNTGILVLPGATLTVFSDNTIASGRNNEETFITALNGGKIIGRCNGTAFENINVVRISNGSEINLESISAIGEFDSFARHYGWQESMASSVREEDVVVDVECLVGEHPNDRYILTKTNTKYNLKSTAGMVHPISASINPAHFGEDAVVKNGTFEVISGNGFNSSDWEANGITEVRLEAGTEVTIRLLPDYGYQFKNGSINGLDIVPDEGSATYTFIMPNNPLHISAIFDKVDDKIVVDEKSLIKNASLDGLQGQVNGSVQFTIENEDDMSAFNSYTEDGAVIVAGLDLTIDQMILKAGTNNEYWIQNITDLNEEMTISLELDDALIGDNEEIYILRLHNGVTTKIPAIYSKINHTLTFKTDGFSTYAIAFDEKTNDTNKDDETEKDETPKTGETNYITLAFVVTAISGIGMFFIRKKKFN